MYMYWLVCSCTFEKTDNVLVLVHFGSLTKRLPPCVCLCCTVCACTRIKTAINCLYTCTCPSCLNTIVLQKSHQAIHTSAVHTSAQLSGHTHGRHCVPSSHAESRQSVAGSNWLCTVAMTTFPWQTGYFSLWHRAREACCSVGSSGQCTRSFFAGCW